MPILFESERNGDMLCFRHAVIRANKGEPISADVTMYPPCPCEDCASVEEKRPGYVIQEEVDGG